MAKKLAGEEMNFLTESQHSDDVKTTTGFQSLNISCFVKELESLIQQVSETYTSTRSPVRPALR